MSILKHVVREMRNEYITQIFNTFKLNQGSSVNIVTRLQTG